MQINSASDIITQYISIQHPWWEAARALFFFFLSKIARLKTYLYTCSLIHWPMTHDDPWFPLGSMFGCIFVQASHDGPWWHRDLRGWAARGHRMSCLKCACEGPWGHCFSSPSWGHVDSDQPCWPHRHLRIMGVPYHTCRTKGASSLSRTLQHSPSCQSVFVSDPNLTSWVLETTMSFGGLFGVFDGICFNLVKLTMLTAGKSWHGPRKSACVSAELASQIFVSRVAAETLEGHTGT